MNDKIFTFKEQLDVGDLGENHFKHYYHFLNPEKSEDLRYDFKIKYNKTIELKTDNYGMKVFNNFFMEKTSNIETGKSGGVFRAKEDKIDLFVYYFLQDKVFVWFDVNTLFNRVNDLILTKNYTIKTIHNKNWITQGYALPQKLFNDIVIIQNQF